ncbi:MAG: DUF2341 domain-containing protein [Bermanella sp.]
MTRFIVFLLVVLCTQTSFARQSCDWPYRTSITITQTDFDGLTDYPVDLFLSSANLHSQYQWSANGNDLRIYSNGDLDPLPFTINSWDESSKEASVSVSVPTLDIGVPQTIYIYYGNPDVSNLSTTISDLPYFTGKVKFHTRSNNGVDPDSYDEAISVFKQGNDNNTSYGCSHPDNFTVVTNQNQGTGRSRQNFIAYSKALFNVATGEGGFWGIRYGADYGYGGGLYIDTVNILDEKWLDDLWWANSWEVNGGISNEVLVGSVYLSEGEHELEIIGGEPGNDGGLTVQFSRDYSDPDEYLTANWLPFTSANIEIRSEACPIPTLSVSYGAHDVCTIDLSLTSSDSGSQSWLAGSSYDVNVNVNNLEISSSATSNTFLDITLPADITLTSYSGSNWSCTGTTGTINCTYDQTISSNASASTLSLTTLLDSGATTGSTQNISATVTGSVPDNDTGNDTLAFAIFVLSNSGIPADCSSPQPGLLVKFFDITGYAVSDLQNAADYQALVDSRATINYLQGQTIFSNINGSGNPFTSVDDYFLAVFEGYIYLANSESRYFGVDGDDAVEAWVDGNIVSAFYGLHAAAGSSQDISSRITLSSGFTPIEFRMQEYTGGDQYDFYWSTSNRSRNHVVIPAGTFYHCAGDPDFQLNSTTTVISDPINGTTFPKAIPSAVMTYTVDVSNPGNISSDLDSTVLVQELASNLELYVDDFDGAGSPIKFTDGSGTNASGLNYVFSGINSGSDSISFSSDGTNFNHSVTNTGGYDSAITHFKLTLPGTFKPTFDGITPTFTFEYQVLVK